MGEYAQRAWAELHEKMRKDVGQTEVVAPEYLRQRLDALDARLAGIQTEANGQVSGLIMGAADQLGIQIPEWQYDRKSNTFRRPPNADSR